MKFIKCFVLLLACLLIFSLISCTKNGKVKNDNEMKSTAPMEEFSGYLMDVKCGTSPTGIALDKSNVKDSPKDHTVECLKFCEKSGYGIMTKSPDSDQYNFTKFNEAGSKIAIDLLDKTTRTKGFSILVKGRMDNGIIKVESLEER